MLSQSISDSTNTHYQINKELLLSKGIIRQGIIKGDDYFLSSDLFEKHIDSLPMENAYLMKNTDEWIVTPHEVKKKRIRRIFSLINNNWSDHEKHEISEFKNFIKNYKGKFALTLPEGFPEETILRFLQATQFNYNKSIEYLYDHINWRKIFFPFELTQPVIDILTSGFLYAYGRDHRFRPISILNTKVYMKLQKKYSYTDFLKSIIYYLEYKIHHLLIPGQIEDWVVISDMRGISVFSIPDDIKEFIKVMQSNYRARLKTNFIIGMSMILRGLWGIIKYMLDPETNKKIKILGDKGFDDIWDMINKDQVEARFEGSCPDLTKDFFPPSIPKDSKGNILNPVGKNTILYSKDEYKQRIKENKVFFPSPFILKELNNNNKSEEKEKSTIVVNNDKVQKEENGLETKAFIVKEEKIIEKQKNKFLEFPKVNDDKGIEEIMKSIRCSSLQYSMEVNYCADFLGQELKINNE